MSQSNPAPRRKKSIVLDGAVASTILVVVVSLISGSSSLLALFALGWLIYGLVVFVRRFGRMGAAVVAVCLIACSSGVYYLYQTGLPKRILYEEIYELGALAVHTDGPAWAPNVHFVIFDKRVGDAEIDRFTQFAGLEHLTYIHFTGSPITDKSLTFLPRLPGLNRLDLKNTAVTPEGVERLQAEHPDWTIKAEWPAAE